MKHETFPKCEIRNGWLISCARQFTQRKEGGHFIKHFVFLNKMKISWLVRVGASDTALWPILILDDLESGGVRV